MREPAALASTAELEAKYGLQVSLVAVTAVGGMVDLRIKILDAGKARQLLHDRAPALLVEGSGAVLTLPEDQRPQDQSLRAGDMVFVLYPNSGNTVKRGDQITVMFGNVRLQPVVAR